MHLSHPWKLKQGIRVSGVKCSKKYFVFNYLIKLSLLIYLYNVIMGKKLLFIFIVFWTTSVSAQIKYGVSVGINIANVKFNSSVTDFQSITSYQIKGILNFHVTKHLSLESGLSLQRKGFKIDEIYILSKDMELSGQRTDYVKVNYLELPLDVKWSVPLLKNQLLIGAGPYLAYGISGKYTTTESFNDGQKKVKLNLGNGKEDFISEWDYGVNFSLGFLFQQKFLFNAGYGLGLFNLQPQEKKDYSYKMNNRVFSLSAGYFF